jgi:hypothetical protein
MGLKDGASAVLVPGGVCSAAASAAAEASASFSAMRLLQCASSWFRSSCCSSLFVAASSWSRRASAARRSRDAHASSSECARFAALAERSSSLREAGDVGRVPLDELSFRHSSGSLLLLLLLLLLLAFLLCEPFVWGEVERKTVGRVKCPFGTIALFLFCAVLCELHLSLCSSLSATHDALRGAGGKQTLGDFVLL